MSGQLPRDLKVENVWSSGDLANLPITISNRKRILYYQHGPSGCATSLRVSYAAIKHMFEIRWCHLTSANIDTEKKTGTR
jgi:hypothetical protein